MHSALFLVLTLVSVAVFFLQENAELLAAVQIIVYASAIVVLFLFVIMLLGVDREEALDDPIKYQRPAAFALGALLLAEVVFLAGHDWATGAKTARGVPLKGGAPSPAGTTATTSSACARVLFTDFLWPFEITAALLVIAVVGAVVLRPPLRAAGRGQPRGGDDPVSLGVLVVTDSYYLVLAALIFTIGAIGLLVRRNVIVMFMCVELMLNAANLTFVAFAHQLNDAAGQVIVFFTLVVAAAEVAVGLAIIVAIFRRRKGATADDVRALRG